MVVTGDGRIIVRTKARFSRLQVSLPASKRAEREGFEPAMQSVT
jgi:hypothetical protein